MIALTIILTKDIAHKLVSEANDKFHVNKQDEIKKYFVGSLDINNFTDIANQTIIEFQAYQGKRICFYNLETLTDDNVNDLLLLKNIRELSFSTLKSIPRSSLEKLVTSHQFELSWNIKKLDEYNYGKFYYQMILEYPEYCTLADEEILQKCIRLLKRNFEENEQQIQSAKDRLEGFCEHRNELYDQRIQILKLMKRLNLSVRMPNFAIWE